MAKAARGEATFAVTADVSEAHRQVPKHPQDWRLLGRQVRPGGDGFKNTLGTFGVASASYYWSRISAALGRLTQHMAGTSATTWHVLVANDFLLDSSGREYRFAIMSFFILSSVFGAPLSWHKTLGGNTLVMGRLRISLMTHHKHSAASRVTCLTRVPTTLFAAESQNKWLYVCGRFSPRSSSCLPYRYDTPQRSTARASTAALGIWGTGARSCLFQTYTCTFLCPFRSSALVVPFLGRARLPLRTRSPPSLLSSSAPRCSDVVIARVLGQTTCAPGAGAPLTRSWIRRRSCVATRGRSWTISGIGSPSTWRRGRRIKGGLWKRQRRSSLTLVLNGPLLSTMALVVLWWVRPKSINIVQWAEQNLDQHCQRP